MPAHSILSALLYISAHCSECDFLLILSISCGILSVDFLDMEILRLCFFCCFIFYYLNLEIVSSYSCDYSECSCVDDMITCVDVTAPRFKYRAKIFTRYSRYLTSMKMQYFNCKWLQDLSRDTYLRTNMCQSYSTANDNVSLKNLTTLQIGTKINKINVKISTQTSYQINNKATRTVPNLITRLITQN